MPFRSQHMQELSVGITTIWSYWTDDTATEVKTHGYFEDFRDNLAVGHWILATTSTGGVMLHVDEIDPLELGSPR